MTIEVEKTNELSKAISIASTNNPATNARTDIQQNSQDATAVATPLHHPGIDAITDDVIANSLTNNNFPFMVLGMRRLNTILLFNKKTRQVEEFKPSDFNSDFFALNFGQQEMVEGFNYKAHILSRASSKGCIDIDNFIGTGIHKIKDEIIFAGKKSYAVRDGDLIEYSEPTCDSRLITSTANWIDSIPKKRNIADLFNELKSYISQWNWSIPEIHSKYMTAFIMLAPFQFILSWRALIYIFGNTFTGKSSLLGFIEELYANLTINLQKSTAHAIAQGLNSNGLIPILDEFEKFKKIPEILELLKSAGSGGNKMSGTPSARVSIYKIKHLFFLCSIYLPKQMSSDQAVRSRTLGFELIKLPGKISLPIPPRDLGIEIIYALGSFWNEIEATAVDISNNSTEYFPGDEADSRLVDNVKYASAILKLCNQDLCDIRKLKIQNDGEDTDADTVLVHLLDCIIKFKYQISNYVIVEESSVANYLKTNPDTTTLPSEFALRGLSINKQRDGQLYLAICISKICDKLLKGSEYEQINPSSVLGRIDGALKGVTTKQGGKAVRCLMIPLEKIHELISLSLLES